MKKLNKTIDMSRKVFCAVLVAVTIIFCSCSDRKKPDESRVGDVLNRGTYSTKQDCSDTNSVIINMSGNPYIATFVSFEASRWLTWSEFVDAGFVNVGDVFLKDISWVSGSDYTCTMLEFYRDYNEPKGVEWKNVTLTVSSDGKVLWLHDIDNYNDEGIILYKCSGY